MPATARRDWPGATRSGPSRRGVWACHPQVGRRVFGVAVTQDSDRQLAWEARNRTRAGIAALIGAVALLAYVVLEQVVIRKLPATSGLETFMRVGRAGGVADL